MARESTTEAAESQRLSSLAISPEDKAFKATLFAGFVDEFAAQLLADVKSALESEASSSEIADEWIREATSALNTLAPELPADFEQRAGFQRAVEMTKKELTAEVCKEMLQPSAVEIRRESYELAQCILANWFALLEHAKEDSTDEVVTLTANGIPEERSLDDLLADVEAFAVPRDKLAPLFDGFLTSQIVAGDTRALAPQLFLARRTEREFFIADTDEAARKMARPAVRAPRVRSTHYDDLFQRIYALLGTIRATAATSDPSSSAYVEQYLARAAAQLALTANAEPLTPAAALHIGPFSQSNPDDFMAAYVEFDRTSNKLPENLALAALYDLDSALGASPLDRIMSWPRRQVIETSLKNEARATVGQNTLPSLRRVATTAAGYVVAFQTASDELNDSTDFTGLKQIFDHYPKAQTVLYLSAAAAHQAVSMPRAAAICTKMSHQFNIS